ncbi:DUF4124 domain-containing protein [Motilimonas pumila]|uniref:DUF4124 domain-containing protein n=1 Tax=Motilimonas pumila TaxID=2303987 RepID=A0A418YK41_9GAMM|nr:DUF4124 domain-containing protein [Motilimonas pumila]RJG51352.1 DUF4124 domain-containing protein [Motilimonas pumila]
MTTKLFQLLLTLSIALASTPSLAKKIYKWVDENGVTHYSDSTPVNVVKTKQPIDHVNIQEDLPSSNFQGVSRHTSKTRVTTAPNTSKKKKGKDPAMQCYNAIKNLTSAMKSLKAKAKKTHMARGMKENEFEKKYSDAMKKIPQAKANCVKEYNSGSSFEIDCLANLSEPEDMRYCMYSRRMSGMSGF